MFIIQPHNRAEKRILDAEYFASLMGVTNDHKVALVDIRYTWIRDNDHGILMDDCITRLVPFRNKNAVIHLLKDPDE